MGMTHLPEWSDPKRNLSLIKIGKGSSTSRPGKGLFRQIRTYIIHDMAGPNVFYLSQLDGKKAKSASEWEAPQLVFNGNIWCPGGIHCKLV
jgi:hypothetical protein